AGERMAGLEREHQVPRGLAGARVSLAGTQRGGVVHRASLPQLAGECDRHRGRWYHGTPRGPPVAGCAAVGEPGFVANAPFILTCFAGPPSASRPACRFAPWAEFVANAPFILTCFAGPGPLRGRHVASRHGLNSSLTLRSS